MDSFLYIWNDKATDKLYIGAHKGTPDDGYISSSKMFIQEYHQRPSDFSRVIVDTGPWKEIIRKEAALLSRVNAKVNPLYYNMHNGDGEFYNKGHTEETRRKMGNSNRGKTRSKETREKLRLSRIGKTESEETRQKKRIASTGLKHTQETKDKIRAARTGKPLSEEHRQKLSISHMGIFQSEETKQKRRVPIPEERKLKISLATKSKPKSEASKEKQRNRKVSEETRAKMRLSAQNRTRKSVCQNTIR